MISGLRRLGLVVSLALVVPASEVAWAQDDDDEEEEDEDEDEEEDEEEEEEEENQPPVTAGGNYTKETYPLAEIQRPLTITKGMAEVRAGIDIDVSAAGAFEKWGLGFNARYGIEDNVEAQFDLRTDLNKFSSFRVGAALEASIVYDLVDFRLGAVVPYTKLGDEGKTGFDIEMGFPFRYAVAKEGGIVALDTLMTFNTVNTTGVEGGAKPDLTPSVGIIVQPVPMLAVKLQGKLIIPDFNTDAENFIIPVSANIQFSPKNTLDIGGEFTFPNLKPPETQDFNMDGEPDAFYEQRTLLLYIQLRV